MATSIRSKVDTELTRRVGKWFTVREIQDKLRINPSTLKPLIMKYARENVLRRRHVKGTARSVQFTPAAPSIRAFQALLVRNMPYRNLTGSRSGITSKTTGRRTTGRTSRSTRSKSRRAWGRSNRSTRRW